MPRRRRYPLIVYQHMLNRWWPPMIAIGLGMFALASSEYIHPLAQFIPWRWQFFTAVGILAILVGLFFIIIRRFAYVWSILLTSLGGVLLSATMEYAQMYLPARVSSNLDMFTNTVGAFVGALLAVSIAPRTWFGLYPALWRLRLLHSRDGTDFGLALLALWVFAQINPSLPMLGNVFIGEVARQPFVVTPPEPFSWLESMAVSLNLLMLGLLLLILLRSRHHVAGALLLVLCTVALAKFATAALLLKSWALLLWLNSEAMLGIFSGMLMVVAASWLNRPLQVWFAAAVALAYVVLAHGVLGSGAPSAAMRLYQWSYGHLLNYNGLSQTISLLFPFLLLIYLWRAATRDA